MNTNDSTVEQLMNKKFKRNKRTKRTKSPNVVSTNKVQKVLKVRLFEVLGLTDYQVHSRSLLCEHCKSTFYDDLYIHYKVDQVCPFCGHCQYSEQKSDFER